MTPELVSTSTTSRLISGSVRNPVFGGSVKGTDSRCVLISAIIIGLVFSVAVGDCSRKITRLRAERLPETRLARKNRVERLSGNTDTGRVDS